MQRRHLVARHIILFDSLIVPSIQPVGFATPSSEDRHSVQMLSSSGVRWTRFSALHQLQDGCYVVALLPLFQAFSNKVCDLANKRAALEPIEQIGSIQQVL